MADWIPDSKPAWWDDVKTLGKNPASSVLGILAATLVGFVLDVWTALVDAILFVWLGSSATSTEGRLGVADLPLFAAETLGLAGDLATNPFFTAVGVVNNSIRAVARSTGPFAGVTALVLWGALAYLVLRGTVVVLSKYVPGVDAVLGRVIP